MKNVLSIIKNRKALTVLVFVVLLVTLFAVLKNKGNSSKKGRSVTTQEVANAKAIAQINQSFEFQAINIAKKEKPVNFTITTVERKDEIKVKNETRRTTSGKDYLLIRIEIDNVQPEKVALNTVDYIRLEGEGGKKYAPDYHNGIVIADPISVRKDLVAFVVEKKLKDFVLYIGELQGEKQKIEVSF